MTGHPLLEGAGDWARAAWAPLLGGGGGKPAAASPPGGTSPAPPAPATVAASCPVCPGRCSCPGRWVLDVPGRPKTTNWWLGSRSPRTPDDARAAHYAATKAEAHRLADHVWAQVEARRVPALAGPVLIQVRARRPRLPAPDTDGLAAAEKCVVDGLRHAGVLADDDSSHVALVVLAPPVVAPGEADRLEVLIAQPCPWSPLEA